MHSIYKITNKLNNKSYIGLTIQGVRTRFLHHLYEMRSGSDFPIHNAIRKYGENNFKLETIFESEDCTNYLLKELEKHYIRLYASNLRERGYNLTEGGDGTLGRIHSEETKQKIRQKAIGRVHSEESKQRMRESHLKRKSTKEWQDWYKNHCNEGIKYNSISIKLEKDGITYEFKSLTSAGKSLNLDRNYLSKLVNNKIDDYKGYKLVSA